MQRPRQRVRRPCGHEAARSLDGSSPVRRRRKRRRPRRAWLF